MTRLTVAGGASKSQWRLDLAKKLHRHPLHHQKIAVSRAIDILEEIYPARCLQKKANKEAAALHLDILVSALETMNGLCDQKDMRENLN